MSLSFLDRGRGVPTVQMNAPQGADMGNSAQRQFPQAGGLLGDTVGDAMVSFQGRASLSLLVALIIMSILFYMWTRDAQGS